MRGLIGLVNQPHLFIHKNVMYINMFIGFLKTSHDIFRPHTGNCSVGRVRYKKNTDTKGEAIINISYYRNEYNSLNSIIWTGRLKYLEDRIPGSHANACICIMYNIYI